MHHNSYWRLSLLFLFVAVSLHAQRPLTAVSELRLSNGLTVWLNEDHTQPKVFGAVVVRAGARDCPGTGIAHYFEHLLFKGTTRIGTVDYRQERPWLDSIARQYDLLALTTDPAQRARIQQHINRLSIRAADYAIPNEFENLISTYGGTGLNAYTSFDETVFHNSFSPQFITQWCVLNADRLISPVFRLFQGELETVYEEKNMYADQMVMQAAEAVQRYALGGTPYAYPIIGTTDNLKNPRLSEMMDFYHRYYVAGNMGLILSGDIAADTLRPLLERTFGRIPAGQVAPRPKSVLRDFRGSRPFRAKLPIPIVKAEAAAFQGPDEQSADRAAFEVMLGMLDNAAGTGLLDSLSHVNRLMEALTMSYDFRDFSVFGLGFVPNLPFGSRRKAARECWRQIARLRAGDFSDADLQMEKLACSHRLERQLESVGSRSALMVNAFSRGVPWQLVSSRPEQVARVSRDDIVRVARRYFTDDSLVVVKRFGRYPKEHLSQPGYRPVRPRHAGSHSAYADSLSRLPYANRSPRLIDLNADAHCYTLRPLVRLWTSPNPANNIFTLRLRWRRGTWSDRRLAPMGDYLNEVGTWRLTRQQLGRRLQRLGATMQVSATPGYVELALSGDDDRLGDVVALAREFMAEAQADERKFKKLVHATRLEERSVLKDNSSIAGLVMNRVEVGDSADGLRRITAHELRRMSGRQLISLFHDVQRSQLDIIYCGRLSDDSVRQAVGRLPIDSVDRPWHVVGHPLAKCDEPVVYVYDNPSARQTIVGTYQPVDPLPTAEERTRLNLWAHYFGGGMSSVMFQDIREFRAYAYSASGHALEPDLKLAPQQTCGFVTTMGTQADKTMMALATLDSLLTDMPVRPANIEAARRGILSTINNAYPDFRSKAAYVAGCRLYGYEEDPDAATVRTLVRLGSDDVTSFYRDHIQRRPRVTVIVGNKRMLDMQQLSRYGRVVVLKAGDIYRR